MNREKLKSALDKKGYVPQAQRQYEVTAVNGDKLGVVSYKAAKAIENNNLDSYTPKDENEKKIFTRLKGDYQTKVDEVEEKKKAERDARVQSNPTYARYDIDPLEFDEKDLDKWAKEHNFQWVLSDGGSSYAPKYEGGLFGSNIGGKKLTTKEAEQDLIVLEGLVNEKRARKLAEEHPVIASVGTVTLAPVRGITGAAAWVDSTYEALTGREGAPDTIGQLNRNTAAMRETVSDKHASKWFNGAEGSIGNYGSLVYNALMSIGDSAVNAYVGGGLAKGLLKSGKSAEAAKKIAAKTTSGLMAADAAATAIMKNKENGMSDKKATLLGTVNGLAEYITEKYSLESIMGEPKTLITGALKSWAAESTEEVFSNHINRLADVAIGQSDGEIRKSYQAYIDSGMSKKDAIKKTISDCLLDDVVSGIVGGFSGIAMGGAYHGASSFQLGLKGNRIRQNKASVRAIVNDALKYDKNTDIYKTANKISEKMSKDKEVSDYQIGKLYNDIAVKISEDYKNNSESVLGKYSGFMPTHYNVDTDEMVKAVQMDSDGFYAVEDKNGTLKEYTNQDFNSKFLELNENQKNDYIINSMVQNELYNKYFSPQITMAFDIENAINAKKGIVEQKEASRSKLKITTDTLNKYIADAFAEAAHQDGASDDVKAYTSSAVQRMAENGVADLSTLRVFAEAYVNALHEKGSGGYLSIVSQTDNLPMALMEYTFGTGDTYLTDALKNNPAFLEASKGFKKSFIKSMEAGVRYSRNHQTAGANSMSAQVEAIKQGDYSSLLQRNDKPSGNVSGNSIDGYIVNGMVNETELDMLAQEATDGAYIRLEGSDALDDMVLAYEAGISPEKVRNDIIAYYRDGVMPEVEYPNDLPFEDDVSFTIAEDFVSQYDNWVKRGRPYRKNITVGRTSEALKSIGVKEQVITWDTSKINETLKKHKYLNDTILKQIPELIEKPIIIMQSKKSDSRITMFGEVYDGDGLPIMAVLELKPLKNKNGIVLDEIKVVSTHSRKNVNKPADMTQTQNIINSSKILYVEPNKNRTDSWLMRTRLQLPFGINQYGSINKITYSSEDVNSSISENSKNDTNRGEINEGPGELLLSEDNRRRNNESAGKQTYGIRQNGEGKSQSERLEFTRGLRERGLTSERTFNNKYVVDVISEDGYNAEMTELADQLKAYGFENVYFITGKGRFKLLPWQTFEGAVANKGRDIYIQYDAETSPAMLANHELAHIYYSDDVRKSVLAGISHKELDEILKRDRYQEYNRIYKSYDKVLEEVVCDILSGMSEHSARFETTINEFWSGIDRGTSVYSASTYAESIDAGGVRFGVSNDKEVLTIKEQLKKNDDVLRKMKPVFNGNVYIENKNKTDNKQWILKLLEKTGYKVNREDVGIIIFDKKRLSKSMSYLKNDAELAAYSALPYVLKNGKKIHTVLNHKARGYDTITIAAPVLINDVRGNMAVTVRLQGDGNYYKVHRILMPDGSQFIYENKKSNSETAAAKTNKLLVDSPTEIASNNNISQNDTSVNSSISENSKDDTRFTLSDNPDTSYLAEPVRELKDDIKEVMLRADAREGKVYTRADVRQVTNSILENIDPGTGRGLSMSKKLQSKMQNLVGWVLNTPAERREKYLKRLASYIAQNAVVYDASDTYDYEGDLDFVKGYVFHSIKLSENDKETLDAIGASGYKALFSSPDRGTGVDVVYDNMSQARPDLFPADSQSKLERIVEIYDFLKEGVKAESTLLIDVINQEDRQKFVASIENEINRAFADGEFGKNSKVTNALNRAEAEHLAEENRLRNMYEQQLLSDRKALKERYEKKIEDLKNSAKQENEKDVEEKGLKPKIKKYKAKATFGENDTGWGMQRSLSSEQKRDVLRELTVSAIINRISEIFDIPVSFGNMTDIEGHGEYKEKAVALRSRTANALPVICYELGIHLDKKYGLSEKIEDKGELTKFLDLQLLKSNKEQSRVSVAIAGFVRTYLNDKENAKAKAPRFYEIFVSELKKNGVLNDLDTVAEMVNAYMSSDFSSRVDAAIVSADDSKNVIQKAKEVIKDREYYIEKFGKTFIDSFLPQKNAMEYVKKQTGNSFSGSNNAYVMATNSREADSRANAIILNGMTDLNGNLTGEKSLLECLEPVRDLKLFDRYLLLKHAPSWLEVEYGSAKQVFADESLNDIASINMEVVKLENEHPEFKQAAANIYEYQRNLMKHFLVESGGMKQETFDLFMKMYPNYVPLFRVDAKNRTRFGKTVQSLANQVLPIKMAKGGSGEFKSPLESIMYNTKRFVQFGTRNQVAQMWGDYADTIDGMGKLIERVRVGDWGLPGDIEKNLEQDGGDARNVQDMDNAIDKTFGKIATGYNPAVNKEKRIVSVLRNGEVAYYQVHDELLYESLADMAPSELTWVIKMSRKIMAPMKMLTTSMNPIFSTTNAFRDIFTAYNNSDVSNPIEFMKWYAKAVNLMVKKSPEWIQYKAMGGGSMSDLSASRDLMKKTLRQIYMKDKGHAARLLSAMMHPVHTLANINDFVESVPRFAEYLDVVTRTGDKALAFYKASDLTTNFRRMGTSGQALNAIYMYNNAAIQGLDRVARSFIDASKPERAKRALKYLIQALLFGVFVRWWNTENDKKGYENLSAYTKNNFYCFSIGDGNFIALPKAREMAILTTTVERALDALSGEEDAFYDFGEYLAQQLIPPCLPDDLSGGPSGWLTTLARNTVLGSLADIELNEDFKGSPVVSSAYEKLPERMQYNEKTTYTAYFLANILSALPFAPEDGYSPMKIDHVLSSTTGILGQMNKALLPMGGEAQRDWSIGVKNKYVRDSNYSTDVLNQVYEMRDSAENAVMLNPTAENALKYEKYKMAASYITEVNKLVKALPADEQREARGKLLDTMNNWNYEMSTTDKYIIGTFEDLYLDKDGKAYASGLPKSDIHWTENKVQIPCQMNTTQYESYTKDVMKAINAGRAELIKTRDYKSADADERIELIKEMDSDMKSAIKKKYQQKYGGKK